MISPMLAFTNTEWVVIIAMAGFYLVLCVRTAWAMRRSGRSFLMWLAITICTTSIPATMVMFRDQRRGYCPADLEDEDEDDYEPAPQAGSDGSGDDDMVTCAKCGRTMRRSQLRRLSGKPKCPHCGSKFNKNKPL